MNVRDHELKSFIRTGCACGSVGRGQASERRNREGRRDMNMLRGTTIFLITQQREKDNKEEICE